mgnify:CR=1 FL=1
MPPSTPSSAAGPVPRSGKPVGRSADPFLIVGIGASAGGLEAFTLLLRSLPPDTGAAFVFVQHLDPVHESALSQLLSRTTPMPVSEVTDGLRVEPNHVYVIPPNTFMQISRGLLALQPREKQGNHAHHPIDLFLQSLAKDRGKRAIGVILSGTASDGTLGLEAIKSAGGITFAQDESAKHDSMPRNAIASGSVDFVLSPEEIGPELARIATQFASGGDPGRPKEPASSPTTKPSRGNLRSNETEGLRQILLALRNRHGIDFSLYKTSTIQRRMNRRRLLSKQDSLAHYAALLLRDSKELDALYADLLIGVTGFFRNAEAFETLKRTVIPRILRRDSRDGPIRVWVLGCSTGQEAYSLAIAFIEASEHIVHTPGLQIFATDLSEARLAVARRGLYAKSLVADLSAERLKRFFVEEPEGYRVSKALRERVVFARQNLLNDPPFSNLDLISCRNLLIYLEPALQQRVFPNFHYALKPDGVLFLGASESIGKFTRLFEPLDKKQKVFLRKSSETRELHRPLSGIRTPSKKVTEVKAPTIPENTQPEVKTQPEMNPQREADRITINLFAPPSVLINGQLEILQFRGPTGPYLTPPVGTASFNLLKMAREGLMLPLRSLINQARLTHRTVRKENVRMIREGKSFIANLEVIPLRNLKEPHYLILFTDRPAHGTADGAHREGSAGRHRLSRDVMTTRDDNPRVADLERELLETKDYLHSIEEQHRTAHEELRSSNEQIQTGHEEVQSANEELETSKEELESTNEELTTVNEEMVHRNAELNQVNADLKNLQASTHTAILLLGRDLTIRRYTPLAERAFNLQTNDLGRPLGAIKHNLDLPNLEMFIKQAIETGAEPPREVRDKDGRWYFIQVRPYLTIDEKVNGAVLALIDIDALKRTEQELKQERDLAEATIRSARDPMIVLESNLRVKSASEAFYKMFLTTPGQTEGRLLFDLGSGEWNIPRLRSLLEQILPTESVFNDFEIEDDFPVIGHRVLMLNSRRLRTDGKSDLILLSMTDHTERAIARSVTKRSEIRYRRLFEAAPDGILILDPVTRKITDANPFMTQLLSCSYEELLGKELWEIGLLKDETASQAVFHELRSKGFIRYEDLPLETKAGDRREVEFISNLYDEEGQRVIQCSIRDITERKHADAALQSAIGDLRNAQAATERASKAKDDFLATLSHELRTPLTPVLMTAEALRDDERLPADAREQLGMIERNIALEARLIDDLLDLTRIAHGKLKVRAQPCDAHELILLAIDIVREEARAHEISLERDLSATPSMVMVDPPRFQQVIWNLLNNAVKFSTKGGRIFVRTVAIRSPEGAPWIRIEVADSGIGIEQERLQQIFIPFDQGGLNGDHRFGGIGLGLAIARTLVELHGGRITAESAGPTRGSTFIVELPGLPDFPVAATPALNGASARGSHAPTPAPTAAAIKPLRLLLVEDHVNTLQTLTRLLERDGHHVTASTTLAEAVGAAEALSFDLVISDLGLPDGTGLELMQTLRDRHGLRGIALSGYGTEQDLQRSQAAGFQSHLTKPVSFAELRRAINGQPSA